MMEVTIQCPHCQMELEAPAELEGKPAICPECQAQFIVRAVDASAVDGMDRTPSSEPQHRSKAPSKPRQEKHDDPKSRKSKSSSASPDAAESSNSVASSAGSATPRFKGLDASLMAELQGDATSDDTAPVPTQPRTASSAKPATRNVQPGKRQKKTAKLLTGEQADTWLPLGADGQLPQLVVKDQQQKEAQQRETKDSNPLVLVAVLVASVAMSLLLLFVPDEGMTSRGSIQESLEALEQFYIGRKQPLEPYQMLVRDAMEHEHEGERNEAKVIYRRLLDMLHAERRNPNEYLTGPPFSSQEPNDRKFEYHLKILLSSR